MSINTFSKEEVAQIVDYTIKNMNQESLAVQIQQHGSEEAYRELLSKGLENEEAVAQVIGWYGSKENALQAMLGQKTEQEQNVSGMQDNDRIYQEFAHAKEIDDKMLAAETVKKLADNYRAMFQLDDARNILIDLAKEYLKKDKLQEVTDAQYGNGVSEYIANAIQKYYGVS